MVESRGRRWTPHEDDLLRRSAEASVRPKIIAIKLNRLFTRLRRFAVARWFCESGLIVATVGAYSENGPVAADIDPRRVRLIARRR